MKIMQVIPYFCFGGAETMCENLTYALRALGHQVVVVSLYDEQTPIAQRMEKAGVEIHYLDKKLGLDGSMVGKLRKLMVQHKPEVVHTHLDVVKYAALAAKLAGVKTCVHTVHNVAPMEAPGKLPRLVNLLYFHLGWAVPVALSGLVQETVASYYHLKREKIPVIYNGIDLSRCHPKSGYDSGDVLTLVHIGRFNQQKNHQGLLEAFRSLREKFPCRLELVGDGELRPQTEALARELGIQDWVCFRGNQEDVHPYLEQGDVFVLPSLYEGMPMTLIEAMATALPIVASRVGGVPDMLEDGKSARLVSSAEEFCQACEALAADPALRERLGREALAQSRRFSSHAMALQYARLYEQT